MSDDVELVSESEVVSKANKKSKKQTQDGNQSTVSESEPVHGRLNKRRSIWWSHFTKLDNIDMAECIYCHRRIGCATKSGTAPLKNHISTCKMYPANIDKRQKLIDLETKSHINDDGLVEKVTIPKLWEFNQELIRKALARMLIIDEFAFSVVEREGFRDFCKVLNPHFVVPSRATVTRDCYSYFIEERKKLLDIFRTMSSRVCLTTDTWTSGQNLCYMCLTAHWECGVLKGQFLHMRCAAHILNLVVKDGLSHLSLSVKKIRALVKYVRSSPARLQKFKACVEEEKIQSKSLVCMDVETRWNSTYLMLESAIKFKKAFSNLLLKDSQFEKEMKKCEGGLIHEDDWDKVNSLLPFLKIFYDATLRFSGTRYVTSNNYINEIFWIGTLIDSYTRNNDYSIKSMALEMRTKYNKYWGDVNKLNHFLFIAKVLDPRWKWSYIKFIVKEQFVDESLKFNLDLNLRSLFESYTKSMPQKETIFKEPSASSSEVCCDESMDLEEIMAKRYEMTMGSSDISVSKTELDKYFAEELEPKDSKFDILQWWKLNQCRYPILSKMARDFLAIPVSTVASESAFSTGGRVLDCFRTSLTTKMVEALVCAQDWLRPSNGKIMIEDVLLELENMEEGGLKDLVMQQPTIIIDETIEENI